MKQKLSLTALFFAFPAIGFAQAQTPAAPAAKPAPAVTPVPIPVPAVNAVPAADPAKMQEEALSSSMSKEQAKLVQANNLESEKLRAETNQMRAEITRLRLERELMAEKNAYEDAQREQKQRAERQKFEEQKNELSRKLELDKIEAEKIATQLKLDQTKNALELNQLQSDVATFQAKEKREQITDKAPEYLEQPLQKDGVLVISDRRIPLNGVITSETAKFVTERIHYWNNKNAKLPIFIVIDESPGGSVMAGLRIVESMQSSEAPVYVVVKSFAASMAASITTLAKDSFAFPDSVILHHQISTMPSGRMNLTKQKEFYEESTRWWKRLAAPIAQKMGLASTDELIKQMYAHSESGDWTEFGTEAQKLKWVNHIITGVKETAISMNPDSDDSATKSKTSRMAQIGLEQVATEYDKDQKPYVRLPYINQKDRYFLYNPENFYHLP